MEKQISLRKQILECKDYLSLCKLTSSDYFKTTTDRYHHYYYEAFSRTINAVKSFLYFNDIISERVRISPFIEVSTLRLYIDLDDVEEYLDGYNFKHIGQIQFTSSYNFQKILNQILILLKQQGYITELPF